MSRGQLFWGAVLVLLGGLMLAGEMGIRLPNGNSLTSLFLPLLFIGLGVWTLFGIFIGRNLETQSETVALQGARAAKLNIEHGAGEFNLHGGAGAAEYLRGSFIGGVDSTSALNGDMLQVRLRSLNDFFSLPPFFSKTQLDWDVSLNQHVPTALTMNLGANRSVLDLHDLKITDIKLRTGASDTVLTLPAEGRLNLDCEIGAASLTVIVPEGVAIRARAAIGAGDFNIDKTRFPNNTSPDFETAPNAVDINIKGGAVSVRIK